MLWFLISLHLSKNQSPDSDIHIVSRSDLVPSDLTCPVPITLTSGQFFQCARKAPTQDIFSGCFLILEHSFFPQMWLALWAFPWPICVKLPSPQTPGLQCPDLLFFTDTSHFKLLYTSLAYCLSPSFYPHKMVNPQRQIFLWLRRFIPSI